MTETVSDERLRQLGEFVEKLDWCIHNDDITDIGAAFKELLALRTPPQNTDGEDTVDKAQAWDAIAEKNATIAALRAERDALAKALAETASILTAIGDLSGDELRARDNAWALLEGDAK